MAEYIERDAAINAVFEAYADGRSAYSALEAIPAADVVPVRHGRWIKYSPHNSDMLTCSECEKYWILDGDQYDYHYCPNCGARMYMVTDSNQVKDGDGE